MGEDEMIAIIEESGYAQEFIASIKEFYDEYQYLTDNQISALENIIEKYHLDND